MTLHQLRCRARRGLGVLAATALLSIPAVLPAAEATAPDGSLGEVILETKDATGQPYNASLAGWWGHEGGKSDGGTRPTFVSMDVSDGKGVVDDATVAALHDRLEDGGSFDSLRVAFVPASPDGSAERPRVSKGENAGEAFTWFADLGLGTALTGTANPNDSVTTVSTLAEYTKWWQAGRPVQGFTDDLKVIDIADDGSTRPSPTPRGRSILDRWPAGTRISLVFYVSDGFDPSMPQVPLVKAGPDGRALTAWLTFETVASPGHPARTSGGYRVLTGAGTGPDAAAKPRTGAAGTSPGDSADGGAGATGGSLGSTTGTGAPGTGAGSGAKDDNWLVSALPGGEPTLYVLLALLVVAVAGGATRRLRAGRTRPAGTAPAAAPDEHSPVRHR